MELSDYQSFFSSHYHETLALGGLFVGLLFGAISAAINFCTMGALSDLLLMNSDRRMRTLGVATATAIIAVGMGASWGLLKLDKSLYFSTPFDFVTQILGGFLFGIGMVLCGGCALRNLLRFGAGDLRSLYILLIVGLFSFISLSGPLAPLRSALTQATSFAPQDIGAHDPSFVALINSWSIPITPLVFGDILGIGLLVFCFSKAAYRANTPQYMGGIILGLCVALGWLITSLSYDDFQEDKFAPSSLTFIRPITTTLDFLMRSTAYETMSYFTWVLIGVLIGSYLIAQIKGQFRISTFSNHGDMIRATTGGMLMGIGGVFGLGCTVGQGITGVSTGAIGSFVTIAAILLGARWQLKRLSRPSCEAL